MMCDICNKREATVHLTEIINDKVTKMHLCEACAKEKGEEMETHFGISDLLQGLADFGVPHEVKGKKNLKCAACGFMFSDFQKIGRLGCPKCYDSFAPQLVPLLKRIHGSDRHMGKLALKMEKGKQQPSRVQELQELKIKLQEAIAGEAFEEAVVIRDKIRQLENSLGQREDNENR
ncbi:MAG: UvrB/UvrC motif-containing protein [Candidatus Omnitrophica bacterium]|nr:UvrB/UvrC motif-containing protein [Candidatus Omnitrophota bacterium]